MKGPVQLNQVPPLVPGTSAEVQAWGGPPEGSELKTSCTTPEPRHTATLSSAQQPAGLDS